ncbi:hypothetical protein [Mycobacterium sp. ST-F2]|uniref:hypothetical protein n=1 Tax=Mycobacterium sp. ST-F2 TaxID=1490484 RepID=UPI001150F8F7|nr:hypothetical protein [Mycobacterium sp. ST-F2]
MLDQYRISRHESEQEGSKMDLALGNSLRVVVAGPARARSRYSTRADGTRVAVGVETDASGTELAVFPATVAGSLVGWVEGATVIAPEPLTSALPPAGTLIEITGSLRMTVRGGDFGATRATITGITGVSDIGNATELLAAAKAAVREQRAAS